MNNKIEDFKKVKEITYGKEKDKLKKIIKQTNTIYGKLNEIYN